MITYGIDTGGNILEEEDTRRLENCCFVAMIRERERETKREIHANNERVRVRNRGLIAYLRYSCYSARVEYICIHEYISKLDSSLP